MVKSDTVVVIASDVHLGAIGSNKSQFNTFLKRLLPSPMLHLILAGDFMDLMCESIPQLNEGAQEIFCTLQALQEKGVDICWILGNHEIPVTGPYDISPASLTGENFLEKLDNFKSKLSVANHFQAVLPKIRFGQYILIENFGNAWEVTPYNSILQVHINPASVCHVLVTHGFQFEHTTPDRSETWKIAIDSPDSLKDIMDFFFNGAVRPISNIFSPPNWNAGLEEVKSAIQTQKKLQKHPTESTSLIHMIDEDPTRVQKFSQEYLQTITKRNYGPLPRIIQDVRTTMENTANLQGISHVLFGHTHEMQVVEDPGKTTIINTGAWQHVRKMTYIEVDNEGNFQIKYIHSKTYWLYILFGLGLVVAIVLGTLALIFLPP